MSKVLKEIDPLKVRRGNGRAKTAAGYIRGVNQALEDAVALATLVGASTSSAGVPRALAAYEGLRRDRTARVQLGSRRQGAGWDSSGSQLIDRRWIYEYDAWAEAVALT